MNIEYEWTAGTTAHSVALAFVAGTRGAPFSFGEESAVRGIDVASFVHPMLLPLRFWSVLLYHDRATPDLAPPIMILASLVLLSIIVVLSVSLTELIGVREGTAA